MNTAINLIGDFVSAAVAVYAICFLRAWTLRRGGNANAAKVWRDWGLGLVLIACVALAVRYTLSLSWLLMMFWWSYPGCFAWRVAKLTRARRWEHR
jgi:hypothetical protein